MRIGQWPVRMTAALATPPKVPETNSTIRRTGTDLQCEEDGVGTAYFRHCSSDSSQAANQVATTSHSQVTSSADISASIVSFRPDLSRDYYKFRWFLILIVMMVIMISINIAITIYLFLCTNHIIESWESVLLTTAFGLVALTIYAGMFVVLMEYHEKIEEAGTKYFGLRPRTQRTCLRVCTGVYAVGVVIGTLSFVVFEIQKMFPIY